MVKLSDIKDADGKEGLMVEPMQYPATPFEFGFKKHYDMESQRQVEIVWDREKLAKTLYEYQRFPIKWEEGTFSVKQSYLKLADALIAQKEELFKIIYVPA